MANSEAFCWKFSFSINSELGRSVKHWKVGRERTTTVCRGIFFFEGDESNFGDYYYETDCLKFCSPYLHVGFLFYNMKSFKLYCIVMLWVCVNLNVGKLGNNMIGIKGGTTSKNICSLFRVELEWHWYFLNFD